MNMVKENYSYQSWVMEIVVLYSLHRGLNLIKKTNRVKILRNNNMESK